MDYQESLENSVNMNDSLTNNNVNFDSENNVISVKFDTVGKIMNSSENVVKLKDINNMKVNMPASIKAQNKSSLIDDNQIGWKDVEMDKSIEQNSSNFEKGRSHLILNCKIKFPLSDGRLHLVLT